MRVGGWGVGRGEVGVGCGGGGGVVGRGERGEGGEGGVVVLKRRRGDGVRLSPGAGRCV